MLRRLIIRERDQWNPLACSLCFAAIKCNRNYRAIKRQRERFLVFRRVVQCVAIVINVTKYIIKTKQHPPFLISLGAPKKKSSSNPMNAIFVIAGSFTLIALVCRPEGRILFGLDRRILVTQTILARDKRSVKIRGNNRLVILNVSILC